MLLLMKFTLMLSLMLSLMTLLTYLHTYVLRIVLDKQTLELIHTHKHTGRHLVNGLH
jgi:hypothetical protein